MEDGLFFRGPLCILIRINVIPSTYTYMSEEIFSVMALSSN